jgi:hypothetical protein
MRQQQPPSKKAKDHFYHLWEKITTWQPVTTYYHFNVKPGCTSELVQRKVGLWRESPNEKGLGLDFSTENAHKNQNDTKRIMLTLLEMML